MAIKNQVGPKTAQIDRQKMMKFLTVQIGQQKIMVVLRVVDKK